MSAESLLMPRPWSTRSTLSDAVLGTVDSLAYKVLDTSPAAATVSVELWGRTVVGKVVDAEAGRSLVVVEVPSHRGPITAISTREASRASPSCTTKSWAPRIESVRRPAQGPT